MTDQTAIEAATRRLSQALDALDAAVERRLEIDRSRTILTEQVHALDADRSKLAADLDVQLAQGAQPRNPRTARSRAGSMPRWRTSARCSSRSR